MFGRLIIDVSRLGINVDYRRNTASRVKERLYFCFFVVDGNITRVDRSRVILTSLVGLKKSPDRLAV